VTSALTVINSGFHIIPIVNRDYFDDSFQGTSNLTGIISLNSIDHFIFVMVKYGVLFEVWTGFLNII
jgi:hypothetical protein